MTRPIPVDPQGLPGRGSLASASVRLQRHLQVIECRYPRVWEHIDSIRRLHGASGLWPSWCHVPLPFVREIVCPEEAAEDPTRLADVAIVAGLASWRVLKPVCLSDRAAPIVDGPFDFDVPPDHLHALLERPVYVELPRASLGSPATGPSRGVLMHLTYDDRLRHAELRLLIEPTRRWTLGSVPLVPLAVPLSEPTLARCLDAVVRDHTRRHDRLARYAVAGELAVSLHGIVRVCTGLAIHLLDASRLLSASLDDPELEITASENVTLTAQPQRVSPLRRGFA